jgi:hypothetical protein
MGVRPSRSHHSETGIGSASRSACWMRGSVAGAAGKSLAVERYNRILKIAMGLNPVFLLS